MSINPPLLSNLSRVWYSAMNGATVPVLTKEALHSINHRYELFDNNIKNIGSVLSHGLDMGYLTQDAVTLAISEKDNIKQVEAISTLLADDYWKGFTTQVSGIINHHKTTVRTLITKSLSNQPELQKKMLASYDNILSFNEKIMDLSLNIANRSDVGDYFSDSFAVKITFNDAVNSQFDVQKYNLDSRLKNCLLQLIEAVMPHQFECPTTYLHEYDNNWLIEEFLDADSMEAIAAYLKTKGFTSNDDLDIEQLCKDLELSAPETEEFLNDYGVEMVLDFVDMEDLVAEIAKLSKVSATTTLKNIRSLSKKYPELLPLVSTFSYFNEQTTSPLFPFESASDIDSSSLFFYSYNHPAEIPVIENTMERFYSVGEVAAYNMCFDDQDVIQYFNNYAIATCLKSLIMAVIELRD